MYVFVILQSLIQMFTMSWDVVMKLESLSCC